MQSYPYIGGGNLGMSLENIKIIFFDIDGTLIDINSKKISERTLKTLNRLKERNYILCLSTGRSPVTVPHFDGWEPDGYLSFTGWFCYYVHQVMD